MDASVKAARAITGVYFQRLVTLGAIVTGILLALLWFIVIWLATKDVLWSLFFIVLVPATIVVVFLYIMLTNLGHSIIPRRLNGQEKRIVGTIGSRLMEIKDTAQTPWFITLFLVGKDVVRGRESSYLRRIISSSSGVREDFLRVRKIFEDTK